jgi:Domain of unknown function (DUF5658)
MDRSLPSLAVAALLALVIGQAPATAQDLVAANTLSTTVLFPATLVPTVSPALGAATVSTAAAAQTVPTQRFIQPGLRLDQGRPGALPALYVMQGALQAMDAHSTYSAIGRGAHEANPLMQGVVGNKGTMLAVKAGVAASTIWMAESMWKRGNRLGAIATMIAANSVTAIVVAHNYRLASRLQ